MTVSMLPFYGYVLKSCESRPLQPVRVSGSTPRPVQTRRNREKARGKKLGFFPLRLFLYDSICSTKKLATVSKSAIRHELSNSFPINIDRRYQLFSIRSANNSNCRFNAPIISLIYGNIHAATFRSRPTAKLRLAAVDVCIYPEVSNCHAHTSQQQPFGWIFERKS